MNKINHVAIIMDGNGRWALKRNKPRNFGHQEGLKNISSLIEFAKKNKIKFLTLFVFSLDNWKRSKKEVNFLFNLLEKFLDKNIEELIKKKIKIKSIGERKKLSKKLINKIKKVEKLSSMNYDITVNLAFNYSSKTEIIESFKKSIKQKKRSLKILLKRIFIPKTFLTPSCLLGLEVKID
jgi:undecaprenyl diphosphate synthase